MLTKDRYFFRLAVIAVSSIILILSLSACERELTISDKELVERASECHADDNMTPGAAVACGNYLKECTRRGKKTGNYLC